LPRATLTERVDKLENMVMKLAYIQMNTEMEIQALKEEMKEFKEEMKRWREKSDKDMAAFKEEMKRWREKSDKDMAAFKEEMKQWREKIDEQIRDVNKRWAELAQKMGTVVEDIAAPNIPRIVKEYFECSDLDSFAIRIMRKNRKTGDKKEFDVVASCGDMVFLVEVKSSVRQKYVDDFVEFVKSGEFYDYFPEYEGKELVPIFASFSISEGFLKVLTKSKIYVMVMGDKTMEIVNFEEVKR